MDFSLFLALLLLLLALLHYGVGREGEDVQSSQEDHQGVRIEKSRDKHLLVCAVRAVGCVAGGNEPTKATELAVDGIPFDAGKHQGEDDHEPCDELDQGGQICGVTAELRLQWAQVLKEVLRIEIPRQSHTKQTDGNEVGEIAVVVLHLWALRWEGVGGKRKDVQRPEEDHSGIGVEQAREEDLTVRLEDTVDEVAHGDEGPKSGHLSIHRVPADR
mmetsp:Transcript_99673/g.138514  ORF Transcript_99673/g.138514 Transcript_99673/m.138514 type:complete len:216 (-) Transcript_99673:259-906(-)